MSSIRKYLLHLFKIYGLRNIWTKKKQLINVRIQKFHVFCIPLLKFKRDRNVWNVTLWLGPIHAFYAVAHTPHKPFEHAYQPYRNEIHRSEQASLCKILFKFFSTILTCVFGLF